MSNEAPFPHGQFFGAEKYIYDTPTGKVLGTFMGRFELMQDGRWLYKYVDDKSNDTLLEGVGSTPREAFEKLVTMFLITNGGLTPTLQAKLPEMRAILDKAGLTE